MRQIKEKAPATPASVTSATQNLQEDDTIKHSKKQPFKVSEYLEYCDCIQYWSHILYSSLPAFWPHLHCQTLMYMCWHSPSTRGLPDSFSHPSSAQPNQNLIEFMESNNEPYQYSEKVRNDWELIEEITALSPSDRDDIIELIEFFVWQNQRKKSYIA